MTLLETIKNCPEILGDQSLFAEFDQLQASLRQLVSGLDIRNMIEYRDSLSQPQTPAELNRSALFATYGFTCVLMSLLEQVKAETESITNG